MGAARQGHVEPGGPPARIALSPTVTMYKQSVGPMDNNAYLLVGAEGNLLIDAADDAPVLLSLIDGRPIDAIVTTHRHHDHIAALAQVARETGAKVLAGSPDAAAIHAATGVEVGGVWDADTITFGSDSVQVIGLVGHTPGSITVVYHGTTVHLFTGDSLFPGGVGRTESSQDFSSLWTDVTVKLFESFDQAVVHPGHGDDTTLEAERPHLDEWRQRGW